MKQSVYLSDFRSAFHAHDRQNQFSYEGLGILFDYLEQYEQDVGEELELDVIALCCEFAESSADDIARDYDIDMEGIEPDMVQQAVVEWLCDHTSVCGETSTGAIIYNSCF